MRDYLNKHILLKTGAAFLFYLGLTTIIRIVKHLLNISCSSNFSYLINEVVLWAVPAIITAIVFKTIGVLKSFKFKDFFWSLFYAGLPLMISFAGSSAILFFKKGSEFKGPFEIICFILLMLTVGLAEELAFRGVFEELLLRRLGNTEKGTALSILIPSFLFGILHLENLLNGQPVTYTLVQVFGAFCMGALFSTIYARRRNIWSVILVHGAVDFMGICYYALYKGVGINDSISVDADDPMIMLLANSAFLVIAVILFFATKKRAIKLRKNPEPKLAA